MISPFFCVSQIRTLKVPEIFDEMQRPMKSTKWADLDKLQSYYLAL